MKVADVLYTLINHIENLHLGSEINGSSRPHGTSVFVVHETAGIDMLEFMGDG
jgi:hypothetical protein